MIWDEGVSAALSREHTDAGDNLQSICTGTGWALHRQQQTAALSHTLLPPLSDRDHCGPSVDCSKCHDGRDEPKCWQSFKNCRRNACYLIKDTNTLLIQRGSARSSVCAMADLAKNKKKVSQILIRFSVVLMYCNCVFKVLWSFVALSVRCISQPTELFFILVKTSDPQEPCSLAI